MNRRVVVLIALLLQGCTDADWDHTLSYVGLGPSRDRPARPASQAATPAPPPLAATDPATAAPAATLPAASSDQWCREIAASAGQDAASQGFDAATQQRRSDSVYRQCMQYPDSSVR